AMLAYLYNGKSDYPRRVLRHMQDPELHGIIYSQRSLSELPLI
ncbi:MAG TPA: helicase DnaB, partial [Prochlorococcaceae cyanobacterium Fu_MAG_134]|nr:helicase DnaB [Prochlorococcaceae cyanobacterium Fu_MAG_134]